MNYTLRNLTAESITVNFGLLPSQTINPGEDLQNISNIFTSIVFKGKTYTITQGAIANNNVNLVFYNNPVLNILSLVAQLN